jgi:transcriptional regulator with XRE-family HTH domain
VTDEKAVIEAVARNCAWFRKERALTLDALARRSGVSKGMLVEIEQGRTNPSIAILCRMANALNVGLGELLHQEKVTAKMARHARGAGKEFWRTQAGSRAVLIDAVRVRDVGGEMWRWSLAPGEEYGGMAHAAGTYEFLYVLRGVLLVEIAGETSKCAAQESLRFLADAPHVYRNGSNAACDFAMFIAESIV